MQHVRTGLVTALTIALLIVPSWPLVGALVVVGALSALDFIVIWRQTLDADRRAKLDAAVKVATEMAERVDRLETQVRFLTSGRGGVR